MRTYRISEVTTPDGADDKINGAFAHVKALGGTIIWSNIRSTYELDGSIFLQVVITYTPGVSS